MNGGGGGACQILLFVSFLFVNVFVDINANSRATELDGAGNADSSGTEPRDYCLHESFNASCRSGYAILMTSASYGRMRLGRCISGDYNLGCSLDVLTYFDSQCSGRESCDINVRNLVDIHPCQKDFMSYLEASYRCIVVSAINAIICPRDGRVLVSSQSGHIVHGLLQPWSSPSQIGTKTCPWTIAVLAGQRIQVKIIILGNEETLPSSHEEAILCSTLFVVTDVNSGSTEVAACAGRSRERHLYTSSTNQVTLFMARDLAKETGHAERADGFPRFILSYEAVGCPDIALPSNAWSKRMGDNVMIKCNDTLETFYLTCQANKWIGEVGNCTQRGAPLVRGSDARTFGQFPAHGIAMAVLLGVALGIFIGMILLLTVHCARRRSVSLKASSTIVMALNKEKDQTFQDGNSRRACSHLTDTNYPSLIMNMEKVYDFDDLHYRPCEQYAGLHGHSQQQVKFRQKGSDYTCAHAQQCSTILRHCRCGASSFESGLEREPLYDGGHPGSSTFDSFDLVTKSGGGIATVSDTDREAYPTRKPE